MNSIIARSYKALYWSFEVIHRSPQLRWMDLSLPGSRELWRPKSVSFLFIQSGKFITEETNEGEKRSIGSLQVILQFIISRPLTIFIFPRGSLPIDEGLTHPPLSTHICLVRRSTQPLTFVHKSLGLHADCRWTEDWIFRWTMRGEESLEAWKGRQAGFWQPYPPLVSFLVFSQVGRSNLPHNCLCTLFLGSPS